MSAINLATDDKMEENNNLISTRFILASNNFEIEKNAIECQLKYVEKQVSALENKLESSKQKLFRITSENTKLTDLLDVAHKKLHQSETSIELESKVVKEKEALVQQLNDSIDSLKKQIYQESEDYHYLVESFASKAKKLCSQYSAANLRQSLIKMDEKYANLTSMLKTFGDTKTTLTSELLLKLPSSHCLNAFGLSFLHQLTIAKMLQKQNFELAACVEELKHKELSMKRCLD